MFSQHLGSFCYSRILNSQCYVFDFIILDMSEENDTFNWEWISNRRDNNLKADETLELAPESWKKWVKGYAQLSVGLQRKIYKPFIVPAIQQKKIESLTNEKHFNCDGC